MAACTIKKKNPDKVKIISVIHMGMPDVYQKYAIYKDYVDLYIGVSQDIMQGMLELGIPKEKVLSMTCPFACEKDIDRFYTENKNLPLCIGYAGRLDSMTPAQKRIDLLLKLIQELVDREINFKLEIAGDGPARAPMEELVQNAVWKNKVTFLGNIKRENIADFWKRQDVCVNVADFEGRSISVIEAMGNGAVPVVTLTSGIREDVEDGVNGYSVPLQDYKKMAERIGYLEENRDKLHIMGQKAHNVVYPKSVMSAHIDFWEGLIQGK
jgi:glycosyltransferase involved in cell wall biosynthesis